MLYCCPITTIHLENLGANLQASIQVGDKSEVVVSCECAGVTRVTLLIQEEVLLPSSLGFLSGERREDAELRAGRRLARGRHRE